jgi:hypothetical protein
MKPIPFDSSRDLAPMPFSAELCRLGLELKRAGLCWKPHVGCFVWDPENIIEADSPFPERIYFVLSIPRFLQIFGSIDAMVEKLVWLPTWHQCRVLCGKVGVEMDGISNIFKQAPPAGKELFDMYTLLLIRLEETKK